MEKRNLWIIALVAIITVGIIACKEDEPPTHEHQWSNWTVTKAPTTTAEGEETRTCSTCGEKETRPVAKLIQREFTDLTFLGKSIKLIDQTGNAQDLKTRGIWQQIQSGLTLGLPMPDWVNHFNEIYNTNTFAICIVGGTSFEYGDVDHYKVLFHENWILTADSNDIWNEIKDAVEYGMTVE